MTGKTENRIRFTKRSLQALRPARKRYFVYDDVCPGLALQVTENGVKTFYRTGRINGRYKRVRIGPFPDLSVQNARDIARRQTGEIASGRDPHADRQQTRNEPTLGELFDAFIEKHAKPYRKPKTWTEYKGQFSRYLKPWASRRLSSITDEDVQDLHSRLGQETGRHTANRVLALLSAMFNKARMLTGWKGENPCRHVTRFPEQSRERFLHPDELPAFFKALEDEPDGRFRDFFTLSLLIGQRRKDMLSMRWDDLNLERGLWNLPETKNNSPLVVHLPQAAIEVLQRRREAVDGSPWVFPGRKPGQHLKEVKTAWARILDRAGLQDVRIHDLRRSLGSYMASGGTSLPIIGRALGHKSMQATQVYARLDLQPVRDAVDAAVASIMQASQKKS